MPKAKYPQRPGQWEKQVEKGQRIQGNRVPLGQKWQAAVIERIPKRNFTSPETFAMKIGQGIAGGGEIPMKKRSLSGDDFRVTNAHQGRQKRCKAPRGEPLIGAGCRSGGCVGGGHGAKLCHILDRFQAEMSPSSESGLTQCSQSRLLRLVIFVILFYEHRSMIDRRAFYEQGSAFRERESGRYYQRLLRRQYGFYVPPGLRVLEVGCGLGDLLAAIKPAAGLGLDFSPAMIALAKKRHPQLDF